ncbi:MAG: hypothetical protein COB98_10775 [Flavobacteriaceae bacterium]|nr:MAG: hypothetical protein COB98_10775 [Flavobacteriaceae bacterium]
MQHSFKICKKNKLILRKIRGNITLDDFKTILNEASNMDDYDANFRAIIDYRGSHVTSSIQEYSSFLKTFNKANYHKNTKIFIIDNPSVFVACNLFKDILESKNTYLFSSPIAALQHLGLQEKTGEFLEFIK